MIEIGKIVNTHALRGELKVQPYGDLEDFNHLDTVYIEGTAFTLTAHRPHKGFALLRLKGIDTLEQAEALKNKVLFVEKEALGSLPEDTYYVDDLIGIEVYEGDRKIGQMVNYYPTGANDVYEIRTESGKRLLLPAIKDCVKSIDLEQNRMEILLLEGLSEDEV